MPKISRVRSQGNEADLKGEAKRRYGGPGTLFPLMLDHTAKDRHAHVCTRACQVFALACTPPRSNFHVLDIILCTSNTSQGFDAFRLSLLGRSHLGIFHNPPLMAHSVE